MFAQNSALGSLASKTGVKYPKNTLHTQFNITLHRITQCQCKYFCNHESSSHLKRKLFTWHCLHAINQLKNWSRYTDTFRHFRQVDRKETSMKQWQNTEPATAVVLNDIATDGTTQIVSVTLSSRSLSKTEKILASPWLRSLHHHIDKNFFMHKLLKLNKGWNRKDKRTHLRFVICVLHWRMFSSVVVFPAVAKPSDVCICSSFMCYKSEFECIPSTTEL